MSAKNIINFDGMTTKKIMQSASVVVPDAVSSISPASLSSGISPSTLFNSLRDTVGGVLLWGFNDAADDSTFFFNEPLQRGDTVALSAVVSTVVTITITDRNGNARTAGKITGVTTNALVLIAFA